MYSLNKYDSLSLIVEPSARRRKHRYHQQS